MMVHEIAVQERGHCNKCSYWEARMVEPDGTIRVGGSNRGGSRDEAIADIILYNPDVFGHFEITNLPFEKEEQK